VRVGVGVAVNDERVRQAHSSLTLALTLTITSISKPPAGDTASPNYEICDTAEKQIHIDDVNDT